MNTVALYRGTAALIWALALWHCWVARGLYLDGSNVLFTMMKNDGYAVFYKQRAYLMALTQAPAATAIQLGVTDSQFLARLFSAGLFFVPTAFYHAALFRARRDPALLAAALCALALVFLPTSFFIVGESNSVGAAVLFAALVLATGTRPTIGDGLLLIVPAALLVRAYETMSCFGPLLAGFAIWRMTVGGWRDTGWHHVASAIYGFAVVLFLVSAALAVQALFDPLNPAPLGDALQNAAAFWRNLQFMLPFGGLSIVVAAALLKPRLLGSARLFWLAAIPLALLALCPLLWLVDTGVRPLSRTHYNTRTVGGFVIAAIVAAVWLYAMRPSWAPRAIALAANPSISRRLLAWQAAALLAAVPADLVLTEVWRHSVVMFQSTIAARTGPIPIEETAFLRMPYSDMIEYWTMPCESVVLRRVGTDGIILPPRDFTAWQPFDPRQPLPPNLVKFTWGDAAPTAAR
jgi:hypothetical protein